MNKNKNVPEIRFKGFNEDWIKCNIDQIPGRTVYNKGKGLTKDDLVKKQKYKPAILYGHIFTQYGNYLKDVIFSTLENSNDSVISEIGDLIIPASSTTSDNAIVKGLAVNKSGILYGGDINIIRFDNNFTNVFLAYYLDNSSLKNRMFKVVQGTTIHHLYLNAIKDVDVQIPLPEEQIQIGNFFKNLDEKLDLEKEKHKKLIKFKKAMLDEMFPKEGEKVPKVRFEGFDDEWEENRLGDIVTFRRGSFPQPYGKKEWYDGEGAKPFVQVADISKEMKLENKTNQRISLLAQPKSVFAKKGTVVVSLQGSIGRVAITQYDAYIDRTVLIFDKYLRRINKLYWSYIISLKFRDEALKAPGGTIKTITKEVLSNFVLRIPSIEEQTLIGNFFNNLDEKIEFSKQKIGKIENFKKAMLEKMFV